MPIGMEGYDIMKMMDGVVTTLVANNALSHEQVRAIMDNAKMGRKPEDIQKIPKKDEIHNIRHKVKNYEELIAVIKMLQKGKTLLHTATLIRKFKDGKSDEIDSLIFDEIDSMNDTPLMVIVNKLSRKPITL